MVVRCRTISIQLYTCIRLSQIRRKLICSSVTPNLRCNIVADSGTIIDIYNLVPWHDCGTLKCENAAICEKVAKCEKNSTLNVKIDAICEKITLNVKK